jgi:D-alanyl-lipoteichoic acid acyltransferase DltB (MBOAT superfamily)
MGLNLSDESFLLRVFLPIGISFYAFQTLSYVIDVYRGQVEPRNNFIDVAVFVSFFPQLVAGPIERAGRLLPQYENRRRINHSDVSSGLQLLLWGFFKKLVIADNLAIIVNKIFETQNPSPALLGVGVVAFGIQIFADFSGYTDIARGSARLLGINLSRNFDNPYLSASPMDFWRRWHISLSTWFRDYVYIPLGGSKAGAWRNAGALIATFLLAGFWHGAAWNFILWGAYHGALLQVHRTVGSGISGWPHLGRVGSIIVTFLLINLGWFFFRADNLRIGWNSLTSFLDGTAVGGTRVTLFLFFQIVFFSLPLWVHAIFQYVRVSTWSHYGVIKWAIGTPLRTATATVLFTGILVIRNQFSQEFIYFQF